MPGDTSAQLVSRLSRGPDLSVMKPLDLGGFAGAFLGGQEAGQGLKQRRAAGEDLGVGDYAGGLARGLLRGRAIQQETQDPAGAVKMKLAEQNQQMGAIQLQEALRRRDEAVKGRAAASEFTPLVGDAIKNGMANDPATQQQILDWLARNPEAAADPSVQNQLKLFSQSKTILEQQEKQRKAIEAARQAVEGGLQPDEMSIKRDDITTKFSRPDQGILSPIGKLQADRKVAAERGDIDAVAELDRAIEGQRSQVNSELERRVREWEQRTGKKMTPEQYNTLFEIATGQRAKEGVEHPVTLQDYISKHIDKAMEQTSVPLVDEKTGKPTGRFRLPRSREEAIGVLTEEFNKGQAAPAQAPPQTAPTNNRVTVISPDGKRFTVPASQLEEAKRQGYTTPTE